MLHPMAGSTERLPQESEKCNMAKVTFDPIIKWFTGRVGRLVYRRSHNGQISVYPQPDMSRVKWSQAQKDHRRRFREASTYASAAIADPDVRALYVQMAVDRQKNPRRPFEMAHSDYSQTGNDLLWQKHMGDQEKPVNWQIDDYPWYFKKSDLLTSKGKKRAAKSS
jgi:hypothetical protein